MIKRGEEMCNETLKVRAGEKYWQMEEAHYRSGPRLCRDRTQGVQVTLDKVTLESRLYIPVTTHLRDPPI